MWDFLLFTLFIFFIYQGFILPSIEPESVSGLKEGSDLMFALSAVVGTILFLRIMLWLHNNKHLF